MSRYVCTEGGCQRGPATGHALHRTSPKGELFAGQCTEHFTGTPEPIAVLIEQRNQTLASDTTATGGEDAKA